MYILGISGSPNLLHENVFRTGEASYHDAGAALLLNSDIVATFEEERLNRIKHTNKLPLLAINACLKQQGITVQEVDYFTFSVSEETLDLVLQSHFGMLGQKAPAPKEFLQYLLQTHLKTSIPLHKIKLFEHHYVHAVTAFYPSPFESALVLTIDGSGGEYSGSVYNGHENQLQHLKNFSVEQSLGIFYSLVTHILGFGHFDEYKVMGLAPYGDPSAFRKMFRSFYKLLPNGDYQLYNDRIERLRKYCIPNGKPGFSKNQMDIAAALQEMLERIVFHIVRYYKRVTGQTKLCLAGGVALNCTLNGKLISSGIFDDVFVYPAASDCGLPTGSAMAAYFEYASKPRRSLFSNIYLGSDIGNNGYIGKELNPWQAFINFEKIENPSEKAAKLIAAGNVIAWVQGRSEFAPRALGNRSILADCRPAENKERINAIVKKREAFRPFAPSVTEERATEYFELPVNSHRFSHMLYIVKVKKEHRQHLGAVTHIDGTARVQTVSKKDNPRYWELIEHFGSITNTPVILNTSFNNNAEPIVDSVNNAVVCFLTTNLDYLIIGDYLVSKNDFQPTSLGSLHITLPSYMQIKKQEVYAWLPGAYLEKEIALTNSFNEKRVTISPGVAELLIQCNGKKSIASLLQVQSGRNEEDIARIMEELQSLWNRRLIILHPLSC